MADELSEEARRAAPKNFFLYVASHVLTKLGDALANPKTTLTWVMSAAGAPGALVSLLVPIRESGSMLPQVVLGGWVRQLAIRKWVWVAGSALQAFAVAGMGAAAAFATGVAAGLWMLLAVVVFSLARSLSSMASQDVKGKTLPPGRRGRASGLAASVSGALTMGAALTLLALQRGAVPVEIYGWLLAGAAGLWIVAAAIFSRIVELPGANGGGAGWRAALERLGLLASDPVFRRFTLARALFVSTALAGPYYVLLARDGWSGRAALLPAFILADGVASTLSSHLWGRWADRSSRRVMLTGAGLASALGVLTFALITWGPDGVSGSWYPAGAFFLLAVAHSGVRLGRQTYVVNLAEGNRRTDYVATSNTTIGALLLASGALGPLVTWIGAEGMLLLLATGGAAGVAIGRGLPEVENGSG